jgi:hypothetical protein
MGLRELGKFVALAQFAYNNSRNSSTRRLPNLFMFCFVCEIRLHVADNVLRGRIPATKDRVEKFYQVRHKLRKIGSGPGTNGQLSTKNLRLKHLKLAPCWIGPFRVAERIRGQAYHLALPEQYYHLHDVVPIQLIEPYKARDEGDLMPMPALEDPQDEWEVEDIKDSARIGSKRYYLVRLTG